MLKIELPNSFDDSLHYNQADQAFLKDCAGTLGEALGELQLFLQGTVVSEASRHRAEPS